MPVPAVQAQNVQQVLGSEGENVKGPLREVCQFGVVVRKESQVEIGNRRITFQYLSPRGAKDSRVSDLPSKEQRAHRMSDNATPVNPSGLTLEQRRAIYREGELALEDAEREEKRLGVWQAFRATNDPSEMDRLERMCDQIDKKHLLKVCERHGITYQQLCSIKVEALLNKW
jgi:hypothetical protein